MSAGWVPRNRPALTVSGSIPACSQSRAFPLQGEAGIPRSPTLHLNWRRAACASAPAQNVPATDDPHLATAYRVLATTPLVDGHNDLPWVIRTYEGGAGRRGLAYDLRSRTPGHTDIPRMREGMVGGKFWSVWIPTQVAGPGASRVQLEQIDLVHRRMIDAYPEAFELALTADDAVRIFREGRIASMIGMEGGHAIENSLGALRTFYELGARYMTLTHSANIDWADSCCEAPEHDGLTEFGREVVREMNRLGMLVDLSHVAPKTMHDALDVSEAPVIFSHSSAYAVTRHPRNVPDDVLRRMAENGGVVMVTFVTVFVNQELMEYRALPPERADRAGARGHPGRRGRPHRARAPGRRHRPRGDRQRLRRRHHAPWPGGHVHLPRPPGRAVPPRLDGVGPPEAGGGERAAGLAAGGAVAARLQAERGPSVAAIAELDGMIPRCRGVRTRLGRDTLALERFRYGPSSFEADVLLRSPRTVLTRYRADLDPRGHVTTLTATAFDPSGAQPARVARTSYLFRGDSVFVSVERGDDWSEFAVAAGRDALPFIDMVHWPFELAFARLGQQTDEAEVPMVAGRTTQTFTLARQQADHAAISHPFRGTTTAQVDALGRILAADAGGTTRALTVERVDDVDIERLAREFAARDARGESFGALSGRAEAQDAIGSAGITIDYGVPGKRGREIFGALVPWNQVWRLGANRATHLTTDRDLVIGDARVPAGSYTLFAIPGPDAWTLIINRQTDITGTAHDSAHDLARTAMVVRMLPDEVEDFTIVVDPEGFLRFRWDRTEASVAVRDTR
jgi:microsomal dipeptidase-like Zn-dependent dipeptidase